MVLFQIFRSQFLFCQCSPLKKDCPTSWAVALAGGSLGTGMHNSWTCGPAGKPEAISIRCYWWFPARYCWAQQTIDRAIELRRSSTGLFLASYPAQPANMCFTFWMQFFLRGGKHPASKVTSFITSALCLQAFGCRYPAQSSRGFSQLCTTEFCISSFPRKESSIMLTYITWAYSSAQLSSKIRRDSKTDTIWEFVFIFYVKDIFPPMSTSLWIKNTWCLTQKHRNYEGTLTSRLAAAAVNTYDKRSILSGLPW